jgi:hypothetical protein
MINFKNIIETSNPEKLDYIITVEGHPVWDYKVGGHNIIYLISEDPWQGCEEEYVTLAELRKYVVSCEIPFDMVELKTEADKQLLNSFKWKNSQLNFSHY